MNVRVDQINKDIALLKKEKQRIIKENEWKFGDTVLCGENFKYSSKYERILLSLGGKFVWFDQSGNPLCKTSEAVDVAKSNNYKRTGNIFKGVQ